MKTYKVTVTTEDNIYHCEVTASNARPCIGRAWEKALQSIGKPKAHSPKAITIEAELVDANIPVYEQDNA